MTVVFVSLGAMLRDFGMPTAALQAQTLSRHQASNLFWINAGLGLTGALALSAATPLVVALYDEPRLGAIIPVMAITLVFGGLTAQPQVQLARSMRFAVIAVAAVVAQGLGLVASIVGAIAGLEYWSLVWAALVTAFSLFAIQSLALRWVPSMPRKRVGTSELVRSGSNFGAAQVLTFAASNADTIAIGALWEATDVGYYNRAYQLLMMPIQAMLAPLTSVVVPMVNRARAAGQSVDAVLLRLQSAVAIPVVLVFVSAASSAPFAVPLLVGDGWEESTQIFQILAVGGAVQAFSHVSYWGFMLHNMSRQLLYYNLVTKLFTILIVFAGALVSVQSVAIAYTLALVVSWPVNLIWLAKCASQRSWSYLVSGLRILLSAVVAFLATLPLVAMLGPDFSTLAGTAIVAGVASICFVGALALTRAGRAQLRGVLLVLRTAMGR